MTLSLALAVTLVQSPAASANVALTQVSSDPYTNTSSYHQTEVEPDTFAYGTTEVSAFQVGRFQNGGGSNVGWATYNATTNTWTHGFLPGITVYQGGTYDRVSDAAVAYDAKHGVWLINSLALKNGPSGPGGAALVVNRSTDGGQTWSNPVNVSIAAGASDYDKNWIVCDNTASSPYYGHCYVEFDDYGNGNLVQMSTSADGGLTWSAPIANASNSTVIGGQPLVQPNGTVIVPINNGNQSSLLAFRSTNGGTTWSSAVTVATVRAHTVAGTLRTSPLPSAEIDAAGKVYVVWQDCRFRSGCKSNDIVMTTSTDGVNWTAVTRIPIDATSGSVDHFIPGLAVDPSTSGTTTHLALTYYYYPNASCTSSTCQLNVGYLSSANGGSTWTAPTQLTGPMTLTWLPNTSQGYMVGDYISTSYVSGKARPVIASATAPTGSTLHEDMYAPTTGLAAAATSSTALTAVSADPVLSLTGDYAPQGPVRHH